MKLLPETMKIEDIRFRKALKKLQAQEHVISDAYEPDIQSARAEKGWSTENSIVGQMFFELDTVRCENWYLQLTYITKQAERLL